MPYKVRELVDKVTNIVMNYTESEAKIVEATNDESWGPPDSSLMYDTSLLVLLYLLKNGNEKVVTSAREHLYDLKSLESFSYSDEQGKDQGINIRHKVKEIIEFVQDDDRLRDERRKAKINRDKYVGMSGESQSYRYGMYFLGCSTG
ncbi:unnamed protein product [Didymodactylos carnosus]|uniref:ENTH domain-containing protein n=1 Tax=Didymodactylos carnosus TaxID=1234261 RepID=A0A814TWB3_9BILA|nr:unnamed protein product [Didymodactylos carnosus]CAF3929316.1 unnamed protein product [Didymodactylos carnosus]